VKCPRCDSSKTRVVDSREGADGRSVRRRRECEACSFRCTTFERIDDSIPMLVKKGGQRESFDRYKVLSGMKRACEKRPVSAMQLDDAVKAIEGQLLESGEKEVRSEVIGEMVIDVLKQLDQVAYVRFASVYREFSDVKEFVDTLRSLAANPSAAKKEGQIVLDIAAASQRLDDNSSLQASAELKRMKQKQADLFTARRASTVESED
ncbi:UNVERIFIED_CONTAM: hypothetical protein GTU68_040609, partial [Idotea baltica]|nr:hypothetical protein [Idotea baltica]